MKIPIPIFIPVMYANTQTKKILPEQGQDDQFEKNDHYCHYKHNQ
jgi:hypothetical protein